MREKAGAACLDAGRPPASDISHDVPVRVLSELGSAEYQRPSPRERGGANCFAVPRGAVKVCGQGPLHLVRSHDVHSEGQRASGCAAATSCTLVVLAECFLASFALKYSSVQKCEREGENDAGFDGEGDGNGRDKPKHRDDTSMAYASVSVEVRRFARFLQSKRRHPPGCAASCGWERPLF
ncbi:putative Checkpoint protein HUS1 [Trypanosoma cruzi]|uniref:Putative Checkpoint protein HUS1 n=1 Tax=Trypanosoma cruzi TaxID=5693 RepID=A0A2V2UNG7_TRYCR|nr:putative Checkpoint protein HUS1 [Trypanosoma cruzi]